MTPLLTDDAYVVVCTDLHRAVGPFLGKATATKVARAMTDEGGCVYLPVIIRLPDGTNPVEVGPSEDEWQPKGYL